MTLNAYIVIKKNVLIVQFPKLHMIRLDASSGSGKHYLDYGLTLYPSSTIHDEIKVSLVLSRNGKLRLSKSRRNERNIKDRIIIDSFKVRYLSRAFEKC